jgi:hypothetical protein
MEMNIHFFSPNGPVKVKLSLFMPRKNIAGADTAPLILNPAREDDEWSTSRLGRFTPGKRTSMLFEQKARCAPE